MESYPNPIDLSATEIFAAASLLGGEMVLGVDDVNPDPLVGRETVFIEGLRSLVNRGLVVTGTAESDAGTDPSDGETEDTIGLEPTLAFVLLALIEPDATFLLSRLNEVTGESLDVSFQLQGSRAVMLTQRGVDGYTLSPLDGAMDVEDMIVLIWNFASMDATVFSDLLQASPQSRVRGQLIALRQEDAQTSYRALAVYRDSAGLWCAARSSDDANDSEFTLLEEGYLWDRVSDIITLTVYPDAIVKRATA